MLLTAPRYMFLCIKHIFEFKTSSEFCALFRRDETFELATPLQPDTVTITDTSVRVFLLTFLLDFYTYLDNLF